MLFIEYLNSLLLLRISKKVSDSAKLLYGLMLDRMYLSIKNNWVDEENRAYIFFTTKDVMDMMKFQVRF